MPYSPAGDLVTSGLSFFPLCLRAHIEKSDWDHTGHMFSIVIVYFLTNVVLYIFYSIDEGIWADVGLYHVRSSEICTMLVPIEAFPFEAPF